MYCSNVLFAVVVSAKSSNFAQRMAGNKTTENGEKWSRIIASVSVVAIVLGKRLIFAITLSLVKINK